ncbi:hypothetical protein GN244_ATG12705 [Phytophthora infestans]|uniref:Uncharacterized protein n=1 Tax=Phytophthora infestans TaxID=4787 RepID=A0A833VZD5_PHYIN|nr:hypothetical protein GN244_ATG12705 [Phytophthora infestans]
MRRFVLRKPDNDRVDMLQISRPNRFIRGSRIGYDNDITSALNEGDGILSTAIISRRSDIVWWITRTLPED